LPLPSPEYSASLDPSLLARRIVLGSGLVFNLAGTGALLTLPLPLVVRLSFVLGWSAWGLREQVRIRRQFALSGRFHFGATSGLAVGSGEQCKMPAEVLSGTVALHRAIWLRYRGDDRRIGVELFLGNSRQDPRFRRAVVLLRLRPYRQNH
jgi:hypothetical protein